MGLAAATAALGAAAVTEAVARAYDRPPTAIAALVALAVVAPVALVRLWPATAAVLSALAALSGLMISYPVTVAGVTALAVLYGVAGRQRPLRTLRCWSCRSPCTRRCRCRAIGRREVLRPDPAGGRGAGDSRRGDAATARRAAPPPGHRTVGRRVADGVRRPRRTSPHRPGTPRRGGAPHHDDRLAGRGGPAHDTRPATGRGPPADCHRGHRAYRADGDAASAGRTPRGRGRRADPAPPTRAPPAQRPARRGPRRGRGSRRTPDRERPGRTARPRASS